jgi:hypothetical protein
MPAATKNILRDLGETKPWRLELRNNDVAIDLTGCRAGMSLTPRSGGAATELSTDNGAISALDASGVISVSLSHPQYAALPIGSYSMRLWIVWSNGEREYLLVGMWSIR